MGSISGFEVVQQKLQAWEHGKKNTAKSAILAETTSLKYQWDLSFLVKGDNSPILMGIQ